MSEDAALAYSGATGVEVEGSQMTVFPGSFKCKAVGDEFSAELIEQLHRVHRELSEMLALATQTPAGESHDAALSCLHAEANALARKFLSLSEGLLAAEGDPSRPNG